MVFAFWFLVDKSWDHLASVNLIESFESFFFLIKIWNRIRIFIRGFVCHCCCFLINEYVGFYWHLMLIYWPDNWVVRRKRTVFVLVAKILLSSNFVPHSAKKKSNTGRARLPIKGLLSLLGASNNSFILNAKKENKFSFTWLH